MNRRTCLMFLLAAAGAALNACETPVNRVRFPQLTYGHLDKIRLDVGSIEIVDSYQEPLTAPNVDHLFPVNPEQTLRQWANDRLVAAGSPDRYARFVIEDAKVIETELPRTRGVRGMFTTDQAQRYDISLVASLEIRETRGNFQHAFARASASRSRTVAEDITLNEREKVWFDLLEATMNDFNASLERQIRNDLGRYLLF